MSICYDIYMVTIPGSFGLITIMTNIIISISCWILLCSEHAAYG